MQNKQRHNVMLSDRIVRLLSEIGGSRSALLESAVDAALGDEDQIVIWQLRKRRVHEKQSKKSPR